MVLSWFPGHRRCHNRNIMAPVGAIPERAGSPRVTLFLDIETRAIADLKKTGVYVYAAHPATEITMVAWCVDTGPVEVWLTPRYNWNPAPDLWESEGFAIHAGGPMPDSLFNALGSHRLVAHNVSFERTLLSGPAGLRLGFPPGISDPALWDCTAARTAAVGLPRTLEGASAALGLAHQKDHDGHKLMLRMCKPRKPRKGEAPGVYWVDDDASMTREAVYCARDVEAERAIFGAIPALRPDEREVWEITERANDTGAPVDMPLLGAMLNVIDLAEDQINAEVSTRTGGAVPKVQDHGALTRWLLANGIDDAAETGVGKAAVAAMIANTGLDPFIRSVLALRQDGGGVSPKKWRAILSRVSADGRLRGALVYCGAAATGRWASRGAQLHNLPRGGSIADPLAAVRDVLAGATPDEIEFIHGPPLVVASELLRPAFRAPDTHWIARGDYSQIEARVNPWLAGATHTLDAFRRYDDGTGPDLYRVAAAGIYRIPVADVTKAQRQIGKVAILALGFQGGKGAFQAMARGYGVTVDDRQAEEIKLAWRAANPEIVGLWHGLNVDAIECMSSRPGTEVPVWTYRREHYADKTRWVKWHKTPLIWRRSRVALALRLLSGRSLVYWTARLEDVETPFGMRPAVIYRAEDAVKKYWREFTGYGGLFCENAVQATARDVMAHAWRNMYKAGMNPILTVHDEGIGLLSRAEYPTAKLAGAAVEHVMKQAPSWAVGLPIAADSSAGDRYIKA